MVDEYLIVLHPALASIPIRYDYMPWVFARLMLKELRLKMKAAEAANANTPLGQHATDFYQEFIAEENGSGMYFLAILQQLDKKGQG
jgi:3-hydroxyisobutyrate dehydrogenase